MPRVYHLHLNNIWQITLATKQLPPIFLCFLSLMSKYSPLYRVLNNIQIGTSRIYPYRSYTWRNVNISAHFSIELNKKKHESVTRVVLTPGWCAVAPGGPSTDRHYGTTDLFFLLLWKFASLCNGVDQSSLQIFLTSWRSIKLICYS
jgi:hypothetical protein